MTIASTSGPVAFVLSGGASLGAIQVGMLRALADRGVRRGQILPLEPLTGLLGFLGAKRNLVPGGALRRLVSRNIPHERLEDLPIPLHVVACDLLSGSEVLLSNGPLSTRCSRAPRSPACCRPSTWRRS